MAKSKKSSESPQKSTKTKKVSPAMSPETQELQLISLANNLALQQLLDGTASSQVISHFLLLCTTKARLEKEKLERENELLRAKTEALESQKHMDQLYSNAIAAMRRYQGIQEDEDDFYEDQDV